MKRRSAAAYIDDIPVHAEKAVAFLAELSDPDETTRDGKTLFAIIRALEVVGEASKPVPDDVRRRFPHVPWRQMSGMRDKPIHDGFGIGMAVIRRAVLEDLPPLVGQLRIVLEKRSGKKTKRDEGR